MNQDRLKLIVKNLELLVDSLKSELDSNDDLEYHKVVPYFNETEDYDEVFVE